MKMPTEEHFAIITTDTHYIPGDERSRTSPGHGYPEHTVETISYESFPTQMAMLERLDRMAERSRNAARIVHVRPLKIKTTTTIEID